MSTAAARHISPENGVNNATTRRPTRAGVSARSGSAPARRSDRRLTLVTDADFDFEPTGPRRPKSTPTPRENPAQGESTVWTEGSAALKAQPRPGKQIRDTTEQLRLAPPAPVSVARMPFVVLTLVLIVGGIAGLLLLNTQINQDAFKLQDLREKQAQLDTTEQQLSKELAEKEAPGNLAAEAARQGMVPAGPPAYITLPDGRILGVPQPAGQARR